MNHPLHVAVAEAIARRLGSQYELLRDAACGGAQHLSLFAGPRKGLDTRLCDVDALVVSEGIVRAVIEVEESGFIPTKICGKFFQAALAPHFIHESRSERLLPLTDAAFVQVLDGSKCLPRGSRKGVQGQMIAELIQRRLPLGGIRDYRLKFVSGASDVVGLEGVGFEVVRTLG